MSLRLPTPLLPFHLSSRQFPARKILSGVSQRASSPRIVFRSGRHASLNAFETTSGFSPFVPPHPSSLPKPQPPKQYPRLIRWGRRLLILSGLTGSAYLIDRFFNYSSLTRSVRT